MARSKAGHMSRSGSTLLHVAALHVELKLVCHSSSADARLLVTGCLVSAACYSTANCNSQNLWSLVVKRERVTKPGPLPKLHRWSVPLCFHCDRSRFGH